MTVPVLRVLRGDNPEWRTVRNELIRNAPNDEWVRTLGEIATALLPVPAVDLRPELQPLLSDTTSRTALVTLVEYLIAHACSVPSSNASAHNTHPTRG